MYCEILDKPQHYSFLECQFGGCEINSLSYKIHKSVIEIKKDLKEWDQYSIMLHSHFERNTDLCKLDSELHGKYIDLFYKCRSYRESRAWSL